MPEKYMTYTAEFKSQMVEEFIKSGLSEARFCREHNINLSTFRTWNGKVKTQLNNHNNNDLSLIEVTDKIKEAMSIIDVEKKPISFSINGFRIEMDECDLTKFIRAVNNA